MGTDNVTMTQPEAAVALATLVAFSDDDPSEAEGIVLRKYFRYRTAESLQKKLDAHGLRYPSDLSSLEPTVLSVLKEADRPFRLRTLAVALLLAMADDNVNQDEMRALGRYAAALELSLAEVNETAQRGLHEVDETVGEDSVALEIEPPVSVRLSSEQAAIALCTMVAFADDEPTDAEAAVIRENFEEDDVRRVRAKVEAEGLSYPADLPRVDSSVRAGLARASRDYQIELLAIAYKTALADGTADASEIALITSYCEQLMIGLGEVKQYFRATPDGAATAGGAATLRGM